MCSCAKTEADYTLAIARKHFKFQVEVSQALTSMCEQDPSVLKFINRKPQRIARESVKVRERPFGW